MAHDYHLPQEIQARIALLSPAEQRELLDLLEGLLNDPEPDGTMRVAVPTHFPYRAGAIVTQLGKYRVCYEPVADQPGVLNIFSISPLPELA